MTQPPIDRQILSDMQITANESVVVRLATDGEGELIRDMMASEQVRGLDWSRVYPYWLVAFHGAELVGAVHFVAGLPVGRLEMLVTKEGLDTHAKSSAMRALLLHGFRGHYENGASAVVASVPFTDKKQKRVLKDRLGGEIIDSANVIIRGLRDGSV